MPITIERDLQRQWLVATATGVITIEAIVELLRTARASVELRMTSCLRRGICCSATAIVRREAVQDGEGF